MRSDEKPYENEIRKNLSNCIHETSIEEKNMLNNNHGLVKKRGTRRQRRLSIFQRIVVDIILATIATQT